MSESQDEYATEGKSKFNNSVPFWGNEASMNLNSLILTNIQSSTYFKVSLFKLKTYHEVIDEIYYQVKHMEPWEKGSRKTGQTGMCGGVRGVGAGGIVSSAYCLLYKLYTLRLTRKQLNGLMNHADSPYIRALGFMYIRYTQPPADLFAWYEEYLQDEEEIDVKAGGGQTMTIGQMLVQWLTKLEWFSTLFPRIPVPIQKTIQQKLEEYAHEYGITVSDMAGAEVGGTASGKHGQQRGRQGGDYAYEEKGRKNYDNRNNYADGYNNASGGGRGGGASMRGRDDDSRNRHYADERPKATSSYRSSSSKYSRSRSRSPVRERSKYSDSERGAGSSSRYRRSEEDDRYDSRRGGDRARDDYYDRDRDSSKHRRRY